MVNVTAFYIIIFWSNIEGKSGTTKHDQIVEAWAQATQALKK